jgi:S1-C subfamily serine protease
MQRLLISLIVVFLLVGLGCSASDDTTVIDKTPFPNDLKRSLVETPYPTPMPAPTPTPTVRLLSDVIEEVNPSVVLIEVMSGTAMYSGSGVIFEVDESDGSALVLTNYHVIEGATSVTVLVNDRSTYNGTLQGVDQNTDLAVVKICCNGTFRSLPFMDPEEIRVGNPVMALGYPLADIVYGSITVTRGIVSALRYEPDIDRWTVQTDASINPGNSGGPLLSESGEIVGINTFQFIHPTEEWDGLNFAVSIQTVKEVLPVLTVGNQPDFPSPETVSQVSGDTYTDHEYWYSIDIPDTWDVDTSDPEAVYIYDEKSGSQLSIQVFEIDRDIYPTLSSLSNYIKEIETMAPPDSENFRIISEKKLGKYPHPYLETVEYITSYHYALDNTNYREIVHWIMNGSYLYRLSADVSEAIFTNEYYSEILNTVKGIQNSFNPFMYTSETYSYSIAHPPLWKTSLDTEFDYEVSDNNGSVLLYVDVYPNTGYSDVKAYAKDHPPTDAIDILYEQLVFTNRPNPSYRLDYQFTDQDTGSLIRGSTLINLVDDNAIYIIIDDWAENWTQIQNLVDEIFLRVVTRS